METAKAPKEMVADKKAAIESITAVVAEHATEAKVEVVQADMEAVKVSLAAVIKKHAVDFPVNVKFRFEKGLLVKFTVTSSISGGGSGSGSRSTGTLTYNGTAFPQSVSCNYSDKKDYTAAVKNLPDGVVFKNWKSAAESILETVYPDVWKRYSSGADNNKFHASSAHVLLERMLKIVIDSYFTVVGTVNGPAAATDAPKKK
jgi:hypothetical protein